MISFSAISVLLVSLYSFTNSYWKFPINLTVTVSAIGILLSLIPVLISSYLFMNEKFSKRKLFLYHFYSFLLSDYFPIWNEKRRFEGTSIFCNQFIDSREIRNETKFATFEDQDEGNWSESWEISNLNLLSPRIAVFDNGSCNYDYKEDSDFSQNELLSFDPEIICGSLFSGQVRDQFTLNLSLETSEVLFCAQFHYKGENEQIILNMNFHGLINGVNHSLKQVLMSKEQCVQFVYVMSAIRLNPSSGVSNFKRRKDGELQMLHTLSIQECIEKIKGGSVLLSVKTEGTQIVVFHGVDDLERSSLNLIYNEFSPVVNSIINKLKCDSIAKVGIVKNLICYDLKSCLKNLKNWEGKRFLVNMSFLNKLKRIKVNTAVDKKVPVSKWVSEEVSLISNEHHLPLYVRNKTKEVDGVATVNINYQIGDISLKTVKNCIEIADCEKKEGVMLNKIFVFVRDSATRISEVRTAVEKNGSKGGINHLYIEEGEIIASVESRIKGFNKLLRKNNGIVKFGRESYGPYESFSDFTTSVRGTIIEENNNDIDGKNDDEGGHTPRPYIIRSKELNVDQRIIKIGSKGFLENNETLSNRVKFNKKMKELLAEDKVYSSLLKSSGKGWAKNAKRGIEVKKREIVKKKKEKYIDSAFPENKEMSRVLGEKSRETTSKYAENFGNFECKKELARKVEDLEKKAFHMISNLPTGWKKVEGKSKFSKMAQFKNEIELRLPLLLDLQSYNCYSELASMTDGKQELEEDKVAMAEEFEDEMSLLSYRGMQLLKKKREILGKSKYINFKNLVKKMDPKIIRLKVEEDIRASFKRGEITESKRFYSRASKDITSSLKAEGGEMSRTLSNFSIVKKLSEKLKSSGNEIIKYINSSKGESRNKNEREEFLSFNKFGEEVMVKRIFNITEMEELRAEKAKRKREKGEEKKKEKNFRISKEISESGEISYTCYFSGELISNDDTFYNL